MVIRTFNDLSLLLNNPAGDQAGEHVCEYTAIITECVFSNVNQYYTNDISIRFLLNTREIVSINIQICSLKLVPASDHFIVERLIDAIFNYISMEEASAIKNAIRNCIFESYMVPRMFISGEE